ncbi:MAG TPA: response regulator [Pseudonocardiaceae bacterium]|nr:response regulator [Pseudonocardiaceae bacterium]
MPRIPKVLIVDDRRENLLALEALMQGLAVEPVPVTSGEAALKKLLVEEYAVLLLDAHMPGMDGFETASHIKQRERTRHIPIIFLTAVDYDAHLAFRSYEAGAVDYITRPFDPWMLRAKVSVFADLWRTTAALAAQAEAARALRAQAAGLRSAVDDALTALRAVPELDGPAGVAVAAATARLADAQSLEPPSQEASPIPRVRVG